MFFQVSQNISRNSSTWKAIQEPGVSEEIPRIAVYLLMCIIFLGPMKMKLPGVCDCRESVSSNEPCGKEHAKKARKEDVAYAAVQGSSARKCACPLSCFCATAPELPGKGAQLTRSSLQTAHTVAGRELLPLRPPYFYNAPQNCPSTHENLAYPLRSS